MLRLRFRLVVVEGGELVVPTLLTFLDLRKCTRRLGSDVASNGPTGCSSRIMRVKCRGTRHLRRSASSVSAMCGRSFGGHDTGGVTGSLFKCNAKLAALRNDKQCTSTRPAFFVHNLRDLSAGGPLVLMSNVRHSVASIAPRRMRAIAVLGSTTTMTVCKRGNVGNMMGVAAGHNVCGAHRVGFACSRNFN